LKEVADSIRYGATIDSLCNEGVAGELMALREGNSALHWAATRPEDNTAPTAVAVGHFVQVVSALSGLPRTGGPKNGQDARAEAVSIGAT
jgi:hypothetical protein